MYYEVKIEKILEYCDLESVSSIRRLAKEEYLMITLE